MVIGGRERGVDIMPYSLFLPPSELAAGASFSSFPPSLVSGDCTERDQKVKHR